MSRVLAVMELTKAEFRAWARVVKSAHDAGASVARTRQDVLDMDFGDLTCEAQCERVMLDLRSMTAAWQEM